MPVNLDFIIVADGQVLKKHQILGDKRSIQKPLKFNQTLKFKVSNQTVALILLTLL